ncbi:IS4 family transposase [Sulfoacidibacillus ferrooxidans]|uniref:Transposase for transposon Tn5 n=1 Tax=Sulfoacidibacillus ferrooxidans TaxID=2005001 RepID=A0A9X2AFW9_9BACL|nr:IS4 family transposase [Sulfoacidibacillus ferrooxidans]MCI0184496.1 Transposase for transposon Tn5 [Sulfoacidibacillus ferrooxidans]
MLWAAKECGTADFGDARLTQRLVSFVAELTEHPQSSLPEALGQWSATKAAHRFFSNEKVTGKAIYDSHRGATLDNMQDQSMILAVQDTTIVTFTLHRKAEGLGPIGQTGLSGFFLHSCLAVSTKGVPQGILAHRLWTRSTEDKGKRELRRQRPLEDKESVRWIDVTKEVRTVVPDTTKVMMVGDRESDIFDLFLLAVNNHDFLVRAAWDRRLHDSDDHLWHVVENAPVLGQTTIKVPRRDERPEREAILTLQAATVTLRTPHHRKKENLAPPTVNALLVREQSPQDGEPPIEWMLLTTLPITTFEEALPCLTWYTYRWRIERYHYILKSGCQIEKLQLETKDRLMRALAVYSIVASRLLRLTYQARETPEAPCTEALRESEWQALYTATHKTTVLPEQPPNMQTAVLWIAKLGGFLGRKSDGNPGLKVLWRGFRRLHDLTTMWEILHPPNIYG